MMAFRWFRTLIGIALVAGLLVAPTPTRRLVTAAINTKSASITEQFTKALRPVMMQKVEGTTTKR